MVAVSKADEQSRQRSASPCGRGRRAKRRRAGRPHAPPGARADLSRMAEVPCHRPQPRGAAHARESPCLLLQDRRRDHVAEHVARQQPRQLGVEVLHVGQPAAQHDHVGIEQVDDLRQAARQAVGVARQRLPARGCSPAAARAGRRLASRASGPSQSRAKAGPETQVSRQPRWPHQHCGPGYSAGVARAADCGPIRRRRMRAAVHPPVHHDTAAAAGAQDDAEHQAMAGAGAVGRLRQGEAVGVVLHPHLAAEQLADVAVEGVAVQRDRVGVLHQSRWQG